MKKDILFLCQYFYPEVNSSATLPFDTAEYLANSGLTVDVLCGYPKEYSLEKCVKVREQVNNVNIRRLRYLQLSRVGKLGRLINYFSFTLAVLCRIFGFRKYGSVIVYSNPPILPIAPIIANKLFKTKFVFVAYDIYPEIAYSSGALTPGSLISKVMGRINKKLYKRASSVVVLTEEMKRFVLENRRGITEDRISVIPNWAHENQCCALKESYDGFGYSEGHFIVTYFGNMGICQDVETMLDAIRRLKDNDDIRFLIVGHGSKKDYVEEQTREFENVRVSDYLTGDEFEQALAISSCSIVSLENGLKGMCAPSKYYSYLQSGQPILAVVEEDSYLAEEIHSENIGRSVRVGDGKALADAILSLASDPAECKKMSDRARALYGARYEKKIALGKYHELMTRVLGN